MFINKNKYTNRIKKWFEGLEEILKKEALENYKQQFSFANIQPNTKTKYTTWFKYTEPSNYR